MFIGMLCFDFLEEVFVSIIGRVSFSLVYHGVVACRGVESLSGHLIRLSNRN